MGKVYLDEITFNAKGSLKRRKSLINELDEIDNEPVLASEIFSKNKSEKKTKKENKKAEKEKKDSEYDIDEDWMNTLTSFKAPKTSRSKKNFFGNFEKKKKKKKKKGEFVSHKKDFEPELALLKNLQMEQSKFVDSIQKKYDQMEGTKSTARGVGKYTTDLILSINNARSLSMQLVDKIISTKKTVAELDFKEKKEFGNQANSEQQNLNNYASTYLKQLVSVGRNNIVSASEAYDSFEDSEDTEDLFESINKNLGDSQRSDDVEKYLKYENDKPKVQIIYHDSYDTEDQIEKYEFRAIDKDGNIIDDYPEPEKTKLDINRTTGIAKDKYGNPYEIIFD